jgi:hypothetical protein
MRCSGVARTIWTGVAGFGLAIPAVAQPLDDPIAASNRLSDPWVAPKQVPVADNTSPFPTGPRVRIQQTQVVQSTPVTWSAPGRRPIAPIMPTPERPMMPCEPVATPDDDPQPPKVTTIHVLDEGASKPENDDAAIVAVIRRSGAATGGSADVRAAVERVCHNKFVDCRTEVAGERQLRVLLTVHSTTEWQRLYERMQNLPQLGEYGLLFQVHIDK